MNDTGFLEFIIGSFIFLIIGVIVGGKISGNHWHTQYCIEQFDQARNGADSVLVISDDKFCVKLLAK